MCIGLLGTSSFFEYAAKRPLSRAVIDVGSLRINQFCMYGFVCFVYLFQFLFLIMALRTTLRRVFYVLKNDPHNFETCGNVVDDIFISCNEA